MRTVLSRSQHATILLGDTVLASTMTALPETNLGTALEGLIERGSLRLSNVLIHKIKRRGESSR